MAYTYWRMRSWFERQQIQRKVPRPSVLKVAPEQQEGWKKGDSQPPYSPELNPVERLFQEIRRRVEGRVYPDLAAKKRVVEAVLEDFAAHPEQIRRLMYWSWISETFRTLSQNMSLP